MVSTIGVDELHAFAARIRLRREWFHPLSFAHYDITPPKRARAVRLGAREVSMRALMFCNFDYANHGTLRPCLNCKAAGAIAGAWIPRCPRCDAIAYFLAP